MPHIRPVAYTADGVQRWTRQYRRRGQEASPLWLAVNPITGAVYVTGSVGRLRYLDFATIAYRG